MANGRTEKIASGLFKPFLAHLKAANDQIAKGGYSITLEPDPEMDAVWFVRFVSTPEVLERVNTIESEILQIEEAIIVQGNETVENRQTKLTGSNEGTKSTTDSDADKAIVIYKPGSHPQPPESNGSATQEESSKVHLLRVLETRKIVLQKEQAMAFARAAAAGFDMDSMAHLISFAECFGAARLKEACFQFMELWKSKHETGQWIEVEAAEALHSQSEFSYFNASGIVLSEDAMKHNQESSPVSGGDASIESAGKDQKIPQDPQHPVGSHQYFQGQYHQTAYPPWQMHPPPGPPIFPPYPMQGMPYYQNYPNVYPPYPPMDDPRFNTQQKSRSKRHSRSSKDNNDVDSEASETGEDGSDQSASEYEKSHKRINRKGKKKKKKPGVVVIRNVNYVASKKNESSGSESESVSESEAEDENVDQRSISQGKKQNTSSSSSNKKEGQKKYTDSFDASERDEVAYGQEADTGTWQAFQSFLLKAEEKTRTNDGDIFAGERDPPARRKESKNEDDPILPVERNTGNVQELKTVGIDSVDRNGIRMKQISSTDEMLVSSARRGFTDSHLKEIEGGGGNYRRATSEEFMIYGHEEQTGRSSLDPLAVHDYEIPSNKDRSANNLTDESFVVPFRSGSRDQFLPESRTAIDIESELPPVTKRIEGSSTTGRNEVSYEPEDLTFILGRGVENISIGYDPAKDYESQIIIEKAVKVEVTNEENISASTNEDVKSAEKDKKLKNLQDGSEKRKKEVVGRKVTSSRFNPLAEAQKRAEKLRLYKADLQKFKKEQEEEQIRRLEALKMERQKRIAARSGSNASHSTSTPQQAKTKLAAKPSPSSLKGSKFSDSDTSKLNGNAHGITRSVSSLSEMKKGSNDGTLDQKKEPLRARSTLKSASSDQARRRSMPEESHTKMSAIEQLDKSKLATLPELKIKSPKASSEAVQNKPASKEPSQKAPGSKTSPALENNQAKNATEKAPKPSISEDNVVIEKTVVMLENEVIPAPLVQPSEQTVDVIDRSYEDDNKEMSAVNSGYLAINDDQKATNDNIVDELNSYEVIIDYSKEESQEISSPSSIVKAYEADDPPTMDSANPEAPSIKTPEFKFPEMKSIDQTPEIYEKPRSKESKGFRKLLKFGKKSHTSALGDDALDSDALSVDDLTAAAVSASDVPILKNLISQDDTQAAATSTKASRPFSLLSPFRRSSEKKIAYA
ncbi:hypothetical protein ACMD2_11098 [Ananas comosus]|uniref:COP1-interacting protein 7 n=1 Tax=Ananas comosus TaxID=4615 RepID=A0A199UKP0_ANACO|nr:hypothetical protein ACMD2_11098 [Ananas comosus]